MTSWIVFSLVILVLIGLDLYLHRKPRNISLKEALTWSGIWISLSLLFNVYVYYTRGIDDALSFFTGYLIEKSLSVDNLFVFLLIFTYFKTPSSSLHKVLFYGVLGALILRAIFIGLGLALIHYFVWMIYLFGLFLIYTGVKLAFSHSKNVQPEKSLAVRLAKKIFPFTDDYKDDRFFWRKKGTPLLLVLIAIETTDVIFALDSIPAILAITHDPYIVYTSNIFAILGLRSLYFVLAHLWGFFHLLHYGLALILVFIGIKMTLSDIYHISVGISLAVVFLILVISILLSLLFPQKK